VNRSDGCSISLLPSPASELRTYPQGLSTLSNEGPRKPSRRSARNRASGSTKRWTSSIDGEDKRAGLKADLREHDDALKFLKREARQAASLPDKLAIQKRIKVTEASREAAWRAYDNEAGTVEKAKDAIIDDVEARLVTTHSVRRVLTIRFIVT
jgi:hypothetical protein